MRFVFLFALFATLMVSSVGRTDESAPLPTPYPKTAASCKACDKPNGCASKGCERLEHLLKAVKHLEAAGLQTEADLIRRQMDGEINALIQSLKGATTACSNCCPDSKSGKLISIQFEVLEVSLTKLRMLGIGFPGTSGDATSPHVDISEAMSGSTVIADANVTKSSFAVLRREGLAKVLAEPLVVTQNGRQVRFVSGGELPVPFAPKIGAQIDVLPLLKEGDEIHLEISVDLGEISVRNDEETEASLCTQRRIKTKLDLNDGQVAILHSPIHRKTRTEAAEIQDSSGAISTRTATNEIAYLILVYPSIEQ